MNKTIFGRRFDELADQLGAVAATRYVSHDPFSEGMEFVDNEQLLGWTAKVKNLLVKICGEDALYYKEFCKAGEGHGLGTNYDQLKEMRSVFLAAKEDFEGGLLASVRGIVHAEVFDSELEQASELLDGGYLPAAAVIAGVVLETALRGLCDDQGIPHGKLNKMNDDLAKAGVYNKLRQKAVVKLADIRNSAAHGNHDQYTAADVASMIEEIRRFLENHTPG